VSSRVPADARFANVKLASLNSEARYEFPLEDRVVGHCSGRLVRMLDDEGFDPVQRFSDALLELARHRTTE
jgi:hypothetical protein